MLLKVRVVRVFTDESGEHGNRLGVVLDAHGLAGELGVRLAAQLKFSETVFVDEVDGDGSGATLRIFTPDREMQLAGHPLIGTARVLEDLTGWAPSVLRPRLAEPVDSWRDGPVTWVRANAEYAPPFAFEQLGSPEAVDVLPVPEPKEDGIRQYWAWSDEAAGTVRARTFVGAHGIREDEATGSAAMLQAQRLGRPLTIRQGQGSMISVRPAERAGWSEVGGRVEPEKDRDVEV